MAARGLRLGVVAPRPDEFAERQEGLAAHRRQLDETPPRPTDGMRRLRRSAGDRSWAKGGLIVHARTVERGPARALIQVKAAA